jgi:phosphoribosylamine-glycine ligase
VLAASGYPDIPVKGGAIDINSPSCLLIHAGTAKGNGGWKVNGGRAVGLVAHAKSLEDARSLVNSDLDQGQICWHGMQVRRDIGLKAMQHAMANKTVEDDWG